MREIRGLQVCSAFLSREGEKGEEGRRWKVERRGMNRTEVTGLELLSSRVWGLAGWLFDFGSFDGVGKGEEGEEEERRGEGGERRGVFLYLCFSSPPT